MTSPAPVPAPATVLVFLDPAFDGGRVADASKPQLMATDLGATRGDGVFESLLAVGGRPRKIQAHLTRLAGSARLLELDIPAEDAWRRAVDNAIAEYRRQPPAAAATGGPAEDAGVGKLIVPRGPEGAAAPTCWVQASAPAAAGRRQRETGI